MHRKPKRMQSDLGVPYSRILLIIGLVLFSGMAVLAVFNISPVGKDAPDWKFFLSIGSSSLFICSIGAVIIPNTKTVTIMKHNIQIGTKSKKEVIPISCIKDIQSVMSFTNQSAQNIKFYKIELNQDSSFGHIIYFKVNTKYNPQAAQYIKEFWTKRDAL